MPAKNYSRVFPLANGIDSLPLRTRSCLVILALTLLVLAAFWPVGNYDFVNCDDDHYVYQNPHLREGLSWKGIRWAFSADLLTDSPHADYWQPVTFLSRMLDVELFGWDPRGHHRINLILHILNAILLFTLLSKMTGEMGPSALVAGLFAVHPLQVEAVAWITARKDLLGTFFGFLTLHAYRGWGEAPSRGRYAGMISLFLLALMSKPVFVTLPLLFLVLDYWPLERLSWKSLLEKIPLFGLSFLFSMIPLIGQPGALKYASPFLILSNIPARYVSYLVKALFPVRLAVDGMLPEIHFHLWQMLGAGIFLIGLSIFFIRQVPKRPYLLAGWGWFLVMLVPTLASPRGEDRFMYVPLAGLALILVWFLCDLLEGRRHSKILLASSLGPLFFVLTAFTSQQVHYWQDSVTLFERSLEVNPENYIAHNQLCAAWLDRGKFEKAADHCSRAVQIRPNLVKAHYNWGLALAGQDRWEEAIRRYEGALRLKPDYLEAHNNVAFAWAAEGRWEEAIRHFEETLRLSPDSAEAHNNLANALLKRDDREGAIRHYREALRREPGASYIHHNLAVNLARQGKTKEAERHFAAAQRLHGLSV